MKMKSEVVLNVFGTLVGAVVLALVLTWFV
jgi:hypothetical protein